MRVRIMGMVGLVMVAGMLMGGGCKKASEPPASKTPGTPAKTPATGAKAPATGTPIKVGAILAITGGASFLGAPEAKTLETYAEQINQAGGVLGHKIQLVIKDSAGVSANALSQAKQLIDEEKVLAIIGPSTSGESLAIKDLCQENKTILLSCAAAETIVNPIAPYVFKTPQKDSDAARRIYETMKELGITKVGVIASNDGFGNGGTKQLADLAPEYGMTIAISESYDGKATDLTDVLTKVKGAGVQAVVNWSVAPAQSLVAKNMKQIGLDVPLFQSHGFGNIKYVQAGGDATNGTIFPCGRLLVAEELPADNPQKKVLVAYKTAYESKYKEDASTFGGHAYDALLILTEAIKKANSVDGAKVRDAIETLHGVVGTGGIFNFSAGDHNGLAKDAFEMLTVENGKFAVYKKK
jgi:branched-chain amino acid transport system substrate-binding protein